MYENRKNLYAKLEEKLDTTILSYINSDRPGFETVIAGDVIDIFIDQLDKIGITKNITLYLYTRGGNTAAAWNIVNLLRLFCDELHVIVPHKAHSAGTLMCIGANSIIMTKQATLGPIDPSLNSELNPVAPNSQIKVPVSVEAVKGYLAFAKEELGIKDDMALSNILVKLSEYVHPLVLGQVYRSRAQMKMLAEKLLTSQVSDQGKVQQIIAFLCSDSGSHDYTINRREAKNSLGLNVKKPDDEEYRLIKSIYDDFSEELELDKVFNPNEILDTKGGSYCIRRAFIESRQGGCYSFSSKGIIKIEEIQANLPNGLVPQKAIKDERNFDGWEKL